MRLFQPVPRRESLRDREQKVYEAIVVRLIAAFYPPCLKEVTTVDGVANDVPFRARGVRVVAPGWTELYPRKSAAAERRGRATFAGLLAW